MTKPSTFLDRLLIYKNYKIFLLILYSILGLLIYSNWNYLSELWTENFKSINREFEEPISIIITMYYWFLSFYAVLFLFYPIAIFDKKYDNEYKVKINLPKLNKKNSYKAIRDILLFFAFPILMILGIFIWLLFDITFGTIGYVLSFLTLILLIISIAYVIIVNIYKFIKKMLSN